MQDVAESAGAPGIAETKAIAEEAFIYGLPSVIDYALTNEFVVDKNSGQCKGPFNTIATEARAFTCQDTAMVTPDSDTPCSMLWLDLRAESMVISLPAVEADHYRVVGPDWNSTTPEGIRRIFRSTTQGPFEPGWRASASGRARPSNSRTCRWNTFADPLHPEGFAGKREGVELTAG